MPEKTKGLQSSLEKLEFLYKINLAIMLGKLGHTSA
jgi:hypothetical protein